MNSTLFRLMLLHLALSFMAGANSPLLAQGVVFVKKYPGQKEEFWEFFAYKAAAASSASIKFTLPNGQQSVVPRRDIGHLVESLDLGTLKLVDEIDRRFIQDERDKLARDVGRFKQIEKWIRPVVERLDVALKDYENGYVYMEGTRYLKSELEAKVAKAKAAAPPPPPATLIPSMEIAGFTYSDIRLNSVGTNSVSFFHSGGSINFSFHTLGDKNMALFKAKWPEQFEAAASKAVASRPGLQQPMAGMRTANDAAAVTQISHLERLLKRLEGIYGDLGNDRLLAIALEIAGQPPPASMGLGGNASLGTEEIRYLSNCISVTNSVIDQAEAASTRFGGSVKEQIDVHAKMVRYLPK